MEKQTQEQVHGQAPERRKKAYATPVMVEQGDFTKTTAGYFVGSYSEWITRRFT
ncbi:keywimysin-related RiPP [Streptomyces sp. NPDC052225]|uniref:keywimysin-related RiPP n=1 Tax=Streptomyces sp. NPDC052225 TaxID=3154949 RepID=UPI00342941C4